MITILKDFMKKFRRFFMDKIKDFIKGKPWYIKVLVLILAGVIAYFNTACAYKLHVDSIDNLTREIDIYRR